ncbi:MAG: hypothetical protein E5W82_17460 [Mesorhizobium sp.]|uniref:hypothetical protein n=1 Tax=Mesorhizobium sp. TaxID=1871066 RepID=UPI0011F86D99|nr:hypothetical protein [Mesorhizobium sp.]TIS57001.1 MAG: hypothetical protein E5W91_14940 [Mesorhizobium sp.]TIS86514.1 MAG: hypothetical protein E5W89_28885 [Mesorhizobium sp.]TJW11949.1 MAG: hypothetical protein E5W82_17460 [Mesorhizobium sp.]TJW41171.1 MAG: hypothetical protein E5W83_26600 [Mesorhizobium sp.]
MAEAVLPRFLYGTFDWRFRGLTFAEQPPEGLLTRASLNHSNPWIVIATVLEFARQGDHTHVPVLSRYYEDRDTPALSRTSLLLTGDLARSADLKLLQQALRSINPITRMHAAEGAALCGQLWLVGDMLNAWENAEDVNDHEVIGYRISELLEEPGGILESYAGTFSFRNVDQLIADMPGLKSVENELRFLAEGPVEFVERTREIYRDVSLRVDDQRLFISEGKIWTMEGFINRLVVEISKEVPPTFYNYRHRFEAYTGIDCTNFFQGGSADRLAIMATLETFLESDLVRAFLPGQRYFNGHLIPS